MYELPFAKRQAMKRLFAAGASVRVIAQQVGCCTNTVKRYTSEWKFDVKCWCGLPSGHKEWCKVRFAFSPNRRGWLAEEWGRRGSSHLAECVDRCYAESKALGHDLGRFVWGSQSATAYAICGTCGKSAKVRRNDGYRDLVEGTALREICLTAEERAAQSAASKEKKQWRSAKRTLVEIQRHLRRPNSPTPASSQAPTSRA